MLPTREFDRGHRHRQYISLGIGAGRPQPRSHRPRLPANSRSFFMVITQEPTQPLATLHRLLTLRFRDPAEQQDVRLPLMIPLSMVMCNIFAQRPPQRALTKENELRQTLLHARQANVDAV